MLKYVPGSLGLVCKTTEAPGLEVCQNMGFRREEVWALPADESPWGKRPSLPSGYGSGCSYPAKEDSLSLHIPPES